MDFTTPTDISDLLGDAAQIAPAEEFSPLPEKNRGGRPKGRRNRVKLGQNAEVRDCIFAAFEGLDGVDGLIAWGRSNRAAFYKLFISCGPRFTPQAAGRRAEKPRGAVAVAVKQFGTDGTQAKS